MNANYAETEVGCTQRKFVSGLALEVTLKKIKTWRCISKKVVTTLVGIAKEPVDRTKIRRSPNPAPKTRIVLTQTATNYDAMHAMVTARNTVGNVLESSLPITFQPECIALAEILAAQVVVASPASDVQPARIAGLY